MTATRALRIPTLTRVTQLHPEGTGVLIEWRALQPGEAGEWQSYVQFRHRTVTVSGSADALVALEGANDLEDPTDVHALHDSQGWEIAHPGIYVLTEVPRFIRARGEAGEAHVRVCATGGR